MLALTVLVYGGSVIIRNGGLNVSNNLWVDPSSGLVGIGTANPTDKLTVEQGNIRINNTNPDLLLSGGGDVRIRGGRLETSILTRTQAHLHW